MIGYLTINQIINDLINREVVKKVFHSVELWEKNGDRYPAYRDQGNDEWFYVGVNDTKVMHAYIRETAGFKVESEIKLDSTGNKGYKGVENYRLVVFNDFENRSFDDLINAILPFSFLPGVRLKKIFNNNDELLREEAKIKDFNFGATTFYKAFDFTVTAILNKKCEYDIKCWSNPVISTID